MGDTAKTTITLSGDITLGDHNICLKTSGKNHKKFTGSLEGGATIDFIGIARDFLSSTFRLPDEAQFPSLQFNEADITVDLSKNPKEISINAESDVSWQAPFGLLNSITLTSLALRFIHNQNENLFNLEAGIDSSNDWLPGATAKVLFAKKDLQVVAVFVPSEFSVTNFINNCLPGKGVNWGDLLPITFKPESGDKPIRIYYATSNDMLQDHHYQKGFNIDQTFIEVFKPEYKALVSLNYDSATGITINGQLGEIDLDFIQLTAPPDAEGEGPVISVSTKGKTFGISSAVTLFQEDLGTLGLLYDGANQQFLGDVKCSKTILGVENPSISFSWSKKDGFQITNWPMAHILENFPAPKALEDASSGQKCSQLVGLVFKETIKTHFTLTYVKGSFRSTNDNISFDLTPTYSISLLKAENVIVSATLGNITITLLKTNTLADLPKILGESLLTTAGQIAAQILSDPAKLTAFMTAVGLGSVAGQVLSGLLCRKCESQNVRDQSDKEVKKEDDKLEEKTQEAENAVSDVESAGDASSAASIAQTTVFVAASTAVGIAKGLIDLLKKLIDLFGSKEDKKKKKKAEDAKRRANDARNNAIDAVKRKLNIDNLNLSFTSPHTINADWSDVAGGNIRYDLTIEKDHKVIQTVEDIQGSQKSVTDDAITYGSEYTVKVRAKVPGYDFAKGDYKTGTLQTTPLLASPEQITQSFCHRDKTLTVIWQEVANAVSYEAGVDNVTANEPVITPVSVAKKSGTVQHIFNTEQFLHCKPGNYQAKVRAIGDHTHYLDSAWANAAPAIPCLPPPADVSQSFAPDTGTITVSFGQVADATGYSLTAVNITTNETVSQPVPVTASGGTDPISHDLKLEEFDPFNAGSYAVEILAVGDDTHLDSDKSQTNAIPALSALGNASQSYRKGQLTATWNSIEGAVKYVGEVMDTASNTVVAKKPIPQPAKAVPSPVTLSFDTEMFNIGGAGDYQVWIRAIGDAQHLYSPFAKATPVTSRLGQAAFNGTPQFAEDEIRGQWNEVNNATSYTFGMFSGETQIQKVPCTQLNGAINVSTADPGVYRFRVRAEGGDTVIPGTWSEAIEFTRPGAPEITNHNASGRDVTATWNQVANATEYELKLMDPNQKVYGPQTFNDVTGSIQLPTTAISGTYTIQVRVKRLNQVNTIPGAWSEGVTQDVTMGWNISLHNDLAGTPAHEGDNSLHITSVDSTPLADPVTIPQGETQPAGAVVHSAISLGQWIWLNDKCTAVSVYQLAFGTGGGDITLNFTDIQSGEHLPQGSTCTKKQGYRIKGQTDIVWISTSTPADIATILKTAGLDAGIISTRLMLDFNATLTTPDNLADVLHQIGYPALDIARGLVAVTAHFASTPNPITRAGVAKSLVSPNVYPGLSALQLATILRSEGVFPNSTKEEMESALVSTDKYIQDQIDIVIEQLFAKTHHKILVEIPKGVQVTMTASMTDVGKWQSIQIWSDVDHFSHNDNKKCKNAGDTLTNYRFNTPSEGGDIPKLIQYFVQVRQSSDGQTWENCYMTCHRNDAPLNIQETIQTKNEKSSQDFNDVIATLEWPEVMSGS